MSKRIGRLEIKGLDAIQISVSSAGIELDILVTPSTPIQPTEALVLAELLLRAARTKLYPFTMPPGELSIAHIEDLLWNAEAVGWHSEEGIRFRNEAIDAEIKLRAEAKHPFTPATTPPSPPLPPDPAKTRKRENAMERGGGEEGALDRLMKRAQQVGWPTDGSRPAQYECEEVARLAVTYVCELAGEKTPRLICSCGQSREWSAEHATIAWIQNHANHLQTFDTNRNNPMRWGEETLATPPHRSLLTTPPHRGFIEQQAKEKTKPVMWRCVNCGEGHAYRGLRWERCAKCQTINEMLPSLIKEARPWYHADFRGEKLWSEDDCTLHDPDHEKLDGAWQRITGRGWKCKEEGILSKDMGDCDWYLMSNGMIVMTSYPGNNDIYRGIGGDVVSQTQETK